MEKYHMLVFTEAGGGAAHSAYLMLKDDARPKLFVDSNPRALLMWANLGFDTCLEANLPLFLQNCSYDFVPCDEYGRERMNMPDPYSLEELQLSLDKQLSNEAIAGTGRLLKPQIAVPSVIVRKRRSAGSTDISLHTYAKESVSYCTEAVLGDEFVIDLCPTTGLVFPRQTMSLRKGGDTFCRLIGTKHYLYDSCCLLAQEAIDAFHIKTPANLQVIRRYEGGWVFVEIGLRVSGASYLNTTMFGGNLFTGNTGDQDFHHIDCTTMLGALRL